MQTTFVSDEQLAELVDSVFNAMLSASLSGPGAAAPPSQAALAATVQISGAFQGAVVLGCSEQFGRLAASDLLGVQQQQVTPADMQDAIAELANIIGGGIKSILPGPSTLSLPSLADDPRTSPLLATARQAAEIHWTWQGENLHLRLLDASTHAQFSGFNVRTLKPDPCDC